MSIGAFFAACAGGDMVALRDLIGREPDFVRQRNADGSTCLHAAVQHPAALALLLEHGADPNVRDAGDNALALHFAAGGGPIESVRLLLDGGSDVHGHGDLHQLDVIGWATVFADARRDVVDLLVQRGARHHVFSAIAMGDLALLRRVVDSDSAALARRLSSFEQEQSALHYVIAPPEGIGGGRFRTGDHYRTLELLIELGADLEAKDARGRTPLEVAMLRGDREAMRLLHEAGARVPEPSASRQLPSPSELASSVRVLTPMLGVPNVEATVEWYRSLGFDLAGSNVHDGRMDWASVTLGGVEIMFVPSPEGWRTSATGVSLWIRTERLDDLYTVLRQRQMERAAAVLAGDVGGDHEVKITVDLHTAFYGQREFCIRDPNGVEVYFCQPVD
ncbi:MAG TPA: ankyrin repeat domain-containing protein [Gemmatimonadaceae bacterium]|nr:ankyrin repeat domain-containing protein [Gemmatimonadaceae bacterium]